MSNPYFQFKRFTIWHDKCAMKVGTDGTLLGAWVDVANASSFLDVGCGSGLIALMLAQRTLDKFTINAIDIDASAILQTTKNIEQSEYTNIKSALSSLQEFAQDNKGLYDIIVSNPPFFQSSLKSPDSQRTLARHTDSLLIEELIGFSKILLSANGRLSFIYPYSEKQNLLNIADRNNLYASRITNVFPTANSQPKRVLMELSVTKQTPKESDLIIEIERHVYTENFKDLVKDFYLKM